MTASSREIEETFSSQKHQFQGLPLRAITGELQRPLAFSKILPSQLIQFHNKSKRDPNEIIRHNGKKCLLLSLPRTSPWEMSQTVERTLRLSRKKVS